MLDNYDLMENNNFLSFTEFKQNIDRIINSDYPELFDSYDKLISEIEQKIESPVVERIISEVEDIHSEIKQTFYKEKLILFPFLEKSYYNTDSIKVYSSFNQLSEQTNDSFKKIKHFKSYFSKLNSVIPEENYKLIENLITNWYEDFNKLIKQKNRLSDSLNLKK